MKSKSVSVLVKVVIVLDIFVIIFVVIGVFREDNFDNIDVLLEEVLVEEVFVVCCDCFWIDGDLDELMEGDVDVYDSLINIFFSEEKDIKGSFLGVECEE